MSTATLNTPITNNKKESSFLSSSTKKDNCTNTNTTTNNNKGKDEHIICSVNDYQIIAWSVLPKAYYEYIASGTDDEQTLYENRTAYKRWFLYPRCCIRDVTNITTDCHVTFPNVLPKYQNQSWTLPLFLSPAGVHGIATSQQQQQQHVNNPVTGELASSAACTTQGILFGVSQHSTTSIEDIVQHNTTRKNGNNNNNNNNNKPFYWWYQAYIVKDRLITMDLIQRAIDGGCQGIIITVDSVKFGYREADERNAMNSLPPPHRLVNYDKYNNTSSSLDTIYNGQQHASWDQNSELMWDQSVTWDDIRAIKASDLCRNIPVIIKGIMTVDDAISAIQYCQCDGIIVSNHGGRQLDGCLSTIDTLPIIVKALRPLYPNIPIFLDGGIRRGTDIIKALALGATAVGIGKPLFYALAVAGQAGVEHILSLFRKEFIAAMALTGCSSIQDITSSIITRYPYPDTPPSNYIRSAL